MFRWDYLENLGSIDGNDGWRRESGGPQGRIFLCRQYLSSLCPVVNRLPFLPRRGGSSSPPWTVKGDRSSAPSSPFVANEPCVFMRFAIRLPDPDCVAPVHLSLIGIYNFINVKFDSDLEREEREKKERGEERYTRNTYRRKYYSINFVFNKWSGASQKMNRFRIDRS